ncbi:isochorismate synthase, chloroplastic-like [Coffea arabica]|uniref:isochorismate synthase n=1 Tax=Coffea arabica TaxID=13443 RepID=A0A6P6X7U4_COFAR|nr:isochorismate synthase, chloroplastic-like [Coffea arabica]XP_027123771.1 isochorismate synthase, chloroplastic-like [Coffea arabica]XP_027123778.1 isochorismate synthase, chloroplastic-like [Coffea arabica]XP_027123779.1 isochorismate synthase, chloroplastic-like [Coffea arabica]
MAAATAGQGINNASFMELQAMKHYSSSKLPTFGRRSANMSIKRYAFSSCSLSMNGCQGDDHDPTAPIGTIETRTFPAVSTPALAVESLNAAIADMQSQPSAFDSGIIRLEVPILEQIEALDWLHSQDQSLHLPRCFFSGRNRITISDLSQSINGNAFNPRTSTSVEDNDVVSVAGVGSAVLFRSLHPFSYHDWLSIKRFLSKNCPLIRAYGAIRFDERASISPEWKAFGSFYFMVPQVEFDELEGSSKIAATIAWDNALSCTYRNAIASLKMTMARVSSVVTRLRQEASHAYITSTDHDPSRKSWDKSVNQALERIKGDYSLLKKVVLARSSKVVTSTDVNPLAWLGSLKGEGKDAYQFCLQPPESPAFIGNTPEQLFRRDEFSIFSEALAATRARGGSESLDLQIAHDLFSSPKDHHEFAIVRENIRRKLEAVCSSVVINPEKVVRKLSRVQHLYGRFSGTLRSEDDEFTILSSLHPTPAVCGFPTEVARDFITDTEMFDRGMYAGPVGFFGGRQSEFAVGIRSALIGKGIGALIYAGLGIVEGSDPALEWEELELKASQFMKLMKLEVPTLATTV